MMAASPRMRNALTLFSSTDCVLCHRVRLVLAAMPGHADRVKAWVERQTQLRLEFSSLDARLRWYGPELVLADLRILDRDGRQPMLAMREGSVALDLWNVLRAGEFVAGRVTFVGPTVTVIRLEDGSIRLLGLGLHSIIEEDDSAPRQLGLEI